MKQHTAFSQHTLKWIEAYSHDADGVADSCMHVGMYVCTCVCVYVCMHACMYICTVCMYVCIYVCMYVCTSAWRVDGRLMALDFFPCPHSFIYAATWCVRWPRHTTTNFSAHLEEFPSVFFWAVSYNWNFALMLPGPLLPYEMRRCCSY